MKTYYELLSVAEDASAGDIKQAFRREIARYHPDKVAHLGPEFLHIAESRAAELTEAYRILIDPMARAQYDTQLRQGVESESSPPFTSPVAPAGPEPAAAPAAGHQERRTTTPPPHVVFKEERATRDEFLRRAALARFRDAVAAALGGADASPANGFDAGLVTRARRGLFGKSDPPVRMLARWVAHVDAAAVEETWTLAIRAGLAGGNAANVFLMGSGMAPAEELAGRIAELRRKATRSGGAAPVVVPVDVRDWEALVPTDAPPAVRSILGRLKKPA